MIKYIFHDTMSMTLYLTIQSVIQMIQYIFDEYI